MRRFSRHLALGVLVVFAMSCCAYAALRAPLGGDYPGPACRGCDFAGPPIDALSGGHLARFFATQPFMGSASLLLRAPVVGVARALGAGQLTEYRVGCLICLFVAAGLIGLLLVGRPARVGWWWRAALLLGLLLAGPLTVEALAWGHPEEPVGGLLCVVALVLAARQRVVLAGLTLGLAIATKQWALLAVIPVLMACSRERGLLLAVAGGVAAMLILPMFVADPGLFLAQNLHAGLPAVATATGAGVTPANIWYAYGTEGGVILGHGGGATYHISANLAAITHPLIFAVGIALPLLYWRHAKQRAPEELLLVLALIFLLRCLLDPLTYSYHHVPFFIAIASYEILKRRGLPFITVYSALAIWAIGHWVAPTGDGATLNRVYLAWALPVALYLAVKTLKPRVPAVASLRPIIAERAH